MDLVNRHARRAIIRDLKSKLVDVSALGQLGGKTRDHPTRQIQKIAACLTKFGFVLPILIDPQNRVIAGWAVVLAAKLLGQARVPAVLISDLSDAELRTLRLALNKLSEYATWDEQALRLCPAYPQ
jgi:ParB-like chromosome segregation protein Spo0J